MAVKRKPTIKATFETGDRPTQAEFGDFIDSYVPIETDGAVGFMEVISTASSLSRPAETLVAIATGAQSGKVGIIEVLATADVTALPAGAVGREVLSADATASAQGHLGGGTFGVQVFETATTAAAQDLLNVVTATETNFGVVEIATQVEMETATATDRAVTAGNLSDAMTLTAPTSTTSGTEHDITGIRANAKRVTFLLTDVSLSGTDNLEVQIGPSGGVETSGYLGAASNDSGQTQYPTDAILLTRANAAAGIWHGRLTWTLLDATNDIWIEDHMLSRSDSAAVHIGAGRKTLAGAFSVLRIKSSGSNTFDGGSITVLVE